MKNNATILAVALIFLAVVLGCEDTGKNQNIPNTSTPAASPTTGKQTSAPISENKPKNSIVDIPSLAAKSPEEFEKNLGKAVSVTKITKTPEEMPGEFRHYDADGLKDVLQVRFYKNRAVSLVLTIPKERQTKTAEELAALGGLDVEATLPATPIATIWKGKYNGVEFEEIKAIKNTDNNFYNLLVKSK